MVVKTKRLRKAIIGEVLVESLGEESEITGHEEEEEEDRGKVIQCNMISKNVIQGCT